MISIERIGSWVDKQNKIVQFVVVALALFIGIPLAVVADHVLTFYEWLDSRLRATNKEEA